MVANHASRLDAVTLAATLPARYAVAYFLPCYLHGTFRALPASRSWPRASKICATIGQPLQFEAVSDDRAGWEKIARALEDAVRKLQEAAC